MNPLPQLHGMLGQNMGEIGMPWNQTFGPNGILNATPVGGASIAGAPIGGGFVSNTGPAAAPTRVDGVPQGVGAAPPSAAPTRVDGVPMGVQAGAPTGGIAGGAHHPNIMPVRGRPR